MRLQNTRDLQHIFSLDSVSKFAKQHNVPVPPMKILEENLTLKEGTLKEAEWLNKYIANGWTPINKVETGSIGSLASGKWTYKKCFEIAKKCSTKIGLSNYNKSAYNTAIVNKWIDDYTWFHDGRENIIIWTQEKCMNEAKQCTLLKDFRLNHRNAYDAACRNNWIKDYSWLVRSQHKNWTEETCKIESQKYTNVTDFHMHSGGAYDFARRHKLLSTYTWLNNKKNL